MKNILTSFVLMTSLALTSSSNAQTNATNWTAADCNGTNHTLFDELDNGKVIVFVWVMPCGSCINGGKAAYNAVQSFEASNPGKVMYYLADDLGDDNCTALTSWINNNSIGDVSKMTLFGNSGNIIKESNFGGTGMPHVIVMGGIDHKIYYNKKNGATNDQAGIESAIGSALQTLSVGTVKPQISFSVSPNPAKESVSISYAGGISKVSVVSVTGQVVKEEVFSRGVMNPVVGLSGIAPGMYTVKVTDDKGNTGSERIIKK